MTNGRLRWLGVLPVFACLASPPAVAQQPASTQVLPGAAETSGFAGARFTSTLVLSNPGSAAANTTIAFIPAPGRSAPAAAVRSLAPGESLRIPSVLSTLFSLTADAGALVVSSDVPVLATLSTQNVADPLGAYGLALSAVPESGLLGAGETGHAIWVSQSADPATGYRTNVAAVLVDPGSAVDVRIFDASGALRGQTTVTSATPASWQARVADLVGAGALDVGRAEFVVRAGRVTGYAVVNDNVTSDAIATQTERVVPGSSDRLLDGAAFTPGVGGSFWSTDVRLFNPGDAPLDVIVDALGFATPTSSLARSIPAHGLLVLPSVLETFGLPAGVAGALRFHAPAPLLVGARTNNVDPTGTRKGSYSAQQPVLRFPDDFLANGTTGSFLGVDQTFNVPGVRSNLALFGGPNGATGTLVLRDATGASRATAPFTRGAFEWGQLNVGDWFPAAAARSGGRAALAATLDGSRVDVVVETGLVDAYLSRIDNGSGDPITCPPSTSCGVAPFAVEPFTVTPASPLAGAPATLAWAFTTNGGNVSDQSLVESELGSVPLSHTQRTASLTFSHPGTHTATLTARLGCRTVTRSITYTVVCPTTPAITTSALPGGAIGSPYAPFALSQGGGAAPVAWSATGLPAGLSLSAAGVLSGTPIAAGTFVVSVRVTDANGCVGAKDLTITICPSITLGPANLPAGTAGAVYGPVSIVRSGGAPPVSFTLGGGALPSGVTLSSAGVLSGTPTQSGTFHVTVVAHDAQGCTGTGAFTLTIACPVISVGPASVPQGTGGIPYGPVTFTQAGGSGAVTFSIASGALPAGLTLAANGTLSGTPTASGSFPVTVRATDANGCTGTVAVTVAICPAIAVSNPATASGQAGVSFSQTFTQTGGVGAVTFSVASGTLPAGLALATNGAFSGTPTVTGSFPITVRATDANGCAGTGATYTLAITCPTIVVGNPAVTTVAAGTPFSQAFTETGGVGAVTFALASGTLPAGLTLAANGTLAGTPTVTGSFPITVKATDANGCSGTGATYTLVVTCPTIAVTNPAVSSGTVGAAFSQAFTAAGGVGAVTFTLASGALPSGVTLAANGTLTGTPLVPGTFPITVKATDANGCAGTGATYTLVVACQTIVVTDPAVATASVGTPFNQTFTAAGGVGAVTFSTASALPSWLTLASDGTLAGTPTQSGTFNVVVRATDANLCFGDGATYALVVSCQPITVGPATLPQGSTGVAYPTTTFTQTGGLGAVTFTQTGALPNGINFTAGVLAGTPTQNGVFPIRVTATDGNGCSAHRDYLLVVVCSGTSITLSPASLPTVALGAAFPPTTFTATGGTGPYTLAEAGALPAGMTFSGGVLSGTPTQAGLFPITVSATDAGGCAGSQDYVVTVTCAGVTITVAPPAITAGTVGSVYTPVTFTASGGTSPWTLAKTGALPPGMTFAGGVLSGTPTKAGTFPIVVTATDALGCTGATSYAFTTVCPVITVTNPSTATGTAGTAFSQTFSAAGGVGTTTFATASALPPGIALSSAGVLSGTTTAAGTFPIVVTATDANGCSGSGSTYTLVISCQTITVTNPGTTAGTEGVAFSQTFTVSGILGTTTWSTASTLPNGLTLNPSTGQLTGTPAQTGTFNITVKATDTNGCSGTGTVYALVLTCPTITVGGTIPALLYNTAMTPVTFTQSGTASTVTWSATGLPTGLSINASTGQVTGTPTATGNFSVTITATDAGGCTGTKSFSVAVAPVLGNDAYNAVGNTQSVVTGFVGAPATPAVVYAPAVLANDLADVPIVVTAGTFGTTSGGSVTLDTAGRFVYTPAVGFTGIDTIVYTGTANGVSATATITWTVANRVWWVDNATSAATNDGRSNTPFKTMTAVGAATTANGDFIYVAKGVGSTTGAYTMKTSQKLIGAGATLTVPTVSPLLIVTGAAASTPTLSGTLTLASTVVVNGIDMSTGASTAITATSITGATVTPRDVTTTTATAVSLTTVDTSTFTFHSVSAGTAASGPVTGISLSGLNPTSGSFTITGSGVNDGSGGLIQKTTNGVSLTNVKNVSLTSLSIQNTSSSGILGTGVTDFSFVNGTIATSGASGTQSNIAFNGNGTGLGGNVAGTLTVTGSTLSGAFYSGLDVQCDSGTVTNANVSNNVIANPGFVGINIVGTGNFSTSFSLTAATIDRNDISGPGAGGIQVNVGNSNTSGPGATAGASAANVVAITNNSIHGIATTGTNAIVIANSGGNPASRTKTNFLLQCNGRNTGACSAPTALPLGSSAGGTVVLVGNNGYADMTGTIDGNAIVATHTPRLGGGNGIAGGNGVAGAGNAWTPHLTLTVTNNAISGTDGNGILLVGRGTSGNADLKIANNTVGAPVNAGGTARQGIRVDAGNAASADDAVCLDVTGNASAGSNGAAGIGVRKEGTAATTNDFGIKGIPQNPPTNTDVQNYINLVNPAGGGTDIINGSNYVQCSTAP